MDPNDDTGEKTAEELEAEAAAAAAGENGEKGEPEDRGDALTPPAGAEDESKSKFVPHARFNEVNEVAKTERAKRLELEEEVARLKGAASPSPAPSPAPAPVGVDLDAKEAEYLQAVMEGETEKALAIRKEINAEIKRISKAEAAAEADQTMTKRETERAVAAVVSESTEAYPFLDPKHETANAQAIKLVIATRNGYLQEGLPAHEAIRKAVEEIAPLFANASPSPAPAPTPAPTPNRDAAALARNAKDALKQPPSLAKAGIGQRATNATAASVEGMSEEDFEKLSEKEKAALRGDAVA